MGTFVALAMLKSHLDPFTVDDISTVVDHDYIAPMFGLARSFVTDLPGDLVCFVSSTPKRSEEFQSLSTAFPRVDDGSVCSIRNSVLKVFQIARLFVFGFDYLANLFL